MSVSGGGTPHELRERAEPIVHDHGVEARLELKPMSATSVAVARDVEPVNVVLRTEIAEVVRRDASRTGRTESEVVELASIAS